MQTSSQSHTEGESSDWSDTDSTSVRPIEEMSDGQSISSSVHLCMQSLKYRDGVSRYFSDSMHKFTVRKNECMYDDIQIFKTIKFIHLHPSL